MINAFQCIFISLIIVHKGSRAVPDDDFRPTPIPLDKWQDKREGSTGTVQEIVKTAAPASVAAVPEHYWEDALRHSVYLTLVRDKIDQLIAKSVVKFENSKPEPVTKEDDDRDMWEKIKSAPFDRLVHQNTAPIGDISVLSKGRLLEQNGGYRFTEDETREKCIDEKCKEGVKAFWSVKRVRQRDSETQPGKYHYEITFSVTSQTLQKEKKSYNNSVRTFTVRESPPRDTEYMHNPIKYGHRPQRAVWVHKNIVPPKHHGNHQRNQGLDRFFSSLFSDEDDYDLPRYKQQNVFVQQQQTSQLSKVGNVGTFGDQRKFMPYPYKPLPYKHFRQPLPTSPPPIIQPYIDFKDNMFNNPFSLTHGDYKNLPSNIVKTTRPAFLPTPVMPVMSFTVPNKVQFSTDTVTYLNTTESITKEPQFEATYKSYNKPKPTPVKVSYFTDYVRPPVFNAPPGVFVTMDKKPFKPMPPLKFIPSSKSRPVDFRPSPQILDTQFSDPDSVPDSAFRPITLGYTDNTTTVKSNITDTHKKRKLSTTTRKPPKTIVNIKPQRTTTTTPDIITAHNDSFDEEDSKDWVNLLGAFSKTTPMVSEKINSNITESVPTSTTPISSTTAMKPEVVYITTTTATLTKRTRPPPKFTKLNKLKKHKRVTTSTTTTTTNAPQHTTVKTTTQDLALQASSAPTNDKLSWKPKNKTESTTLLTTLLNTTVRTSTQPTTTTKQSTITLPTASSTITSTTNITADVDVPATTQPKYKNRYRISTLMQKGTSVKHDRWNGAATEKNKLISSHKPFRRNESNFQGHSSTTLRTQDVKQNKEHLSTILSEVNNTSEKITTEAESKSQVQTENLTDQYSTSSIGAAVTSEESDIEKFKEIHIKDDSAHDIKDQNEYIFNVTSPYVDKSDDIGDNIITTEQIITTTPKTIVKNKSRCKKKKHNNNTTATVKKFNNNLHHEETIISNNTTTENSLSSGFFDELLRSFNADTTVETQLKPQPIIKDKEENESLEQFTNTGDIEHFLDSLEDKSKNDNEKREEFYEYDDKDSSLELSPFNNEGENHAARGSDEYNDYHDRPLTLFELMAME